LDFINALDHLSAGYIVTQLLTGLALGFLMGMTGIGAGILTIPALLFLAKTDPATAVGTSLLFSLVSKGYGVFEHWRMGMVAGQATRSFLIGALPLLLLASFAVNIFEKSIPEETFNLTMEILIAVLLLAACIYMLWDSLRKDQKIISRCDELFTRKEQIKAGLLGSAIGVVVGATSIGGGIFVIPLLNGVFRLSPQCVVGSSIMISAGLSLIGSGVYLFYGNINLVVAMLLIIGSLPGIKMGCRAANRLPQIYLKRIIAGVAVFSFAAMVLGIGH
jgi:uncharacterized membrane protein YfcA